jgi:hypothetical protein
MTEYLNLLMPLDLGFATPENRVLMGSMHVVGLESIDAALVGTHLLVGVLRGDSRDDGHVARWHECPTTRVSPAPRRLPRG